jgi:hypothetical protein
MLQIIALVSGLGLLSLAVYFFGADSRDGRDWRAQPPRDCTPGCN